MKSMLMNARSGLSGNIKLLKRPALKNQKDTNDTIIINFLHGLSPR